MMDCMPWAMGSLEATSAPGSPALLGTPSSNMLGEGEDLHRRIPAEKWCVTISDLKEFVQDVREAWENGDIPDNAEYPNPMHDDEIYGPNLYQVNEHFVKPLTLQAGGMSYALMKHPEGLACEVFVTHAWAEGIFEFEDKVHRAWPWRQRNLYCCLLANPQNLDISELLDVPPTQSPFAKALNSATYILVVPNSNVSIYDRLWCVFEAYLAHTWNKTFLLPAKPPTEMRLKRHLKTILIPIAAAAILGGGLAGTLLLKVSEDNQILRSIVDDGIDIILVVDVCFHAYQSVFCWIFGSHLQMSLLSGVLRIGHILVMSCYTVLWVFWLRVRSFEPFPFRFMHSMWMLAVGGLSVLTVIIDNENLLLRRERNRQAGQLFAAGQSVRCARCSNAGDERRIRHAIAGNEDYVDDAIKVLMSAGAYTDELREAYQHGYDVTGQGYVSGLSITGSTLLWLTVVMTAINRALKWRKFIQVLYVAVAIVISIVFLQMMTVPCLLWRLKAVSPDRAVFALHAWSAAAVVALALEIIFLGVPGVTSKRKEYDYYKVHNVYAWRFPLPVLETAFFFPLVCTFMALACMVFGRARLLRCLKAGVCCSSTSPHASSACLDEELADSSSSSSSSSDDSDDPESRSPE